MIKLSNTDLPQQMIANGGNFAGDWSTPATTAQMHAVLNAHQILPVGEYHEVAALAQCYGTDRVAIWQARAWRAGADQRRITPDYYIACAASEALNAHRQQKQPPAIAAEPAAPPVSAPAPDNLRSTRHTHFAAQLAAAYQQPVRDVRMLAGADPALIAQWAAVADDPGMQRWDDPLAYALTQIRNQNEPPSAPVLRGWEQRVDPIAVGHAVRAKREARFTQCRATAQQLADAIQLSDALPVPPQHIQYEISDTTATLFCLTAIDTVTQDVLAAALTAALARLGWVLAGEVIVVTPPDPRPPPVAYAPVAPVAVQRPPPQSAGAEGRLPAPDWITASDWAALPALARAALAGTQYDAQGTIVGGHLHALARVAPAVIQHLRATYNLQYSGIATEVQESDAAGPHHLTRQPFSGYRSRARRLARDDRP